VHRPPARQLALRHRHLLEVIAHAWDGAPDEACGLLVGRGDRVEVFVPCRNADRSSRTFSIGPDGWRAADEVIDARPREGLAVIGVVHSHTHTEAYPSPTDVEKASNPMLAGWHWVLVSLRPPAPVVRSYLVEDGNIVEEPIVQVGH
jgi:proteasome lid subunit RPN8/RPN11